MLGSSDIFCSFVSKIKKKGELKKITKNVDFEGLLWRVGTKAIRSIFSSKARLKIVQYHLFDRIGKVIMHLLNQTFVFLQLKQKGLW
jgi:hypothetical protein